VHRGDGLGLAHAVVTVADPSGRQEARTVTDSDGDYRVPLQHGGTFLVVAAAAGTYQPHAAPVAVSDGPVRHDVAPTGTSSVRGTVRADRPVAGITVTLIDVRGDVAAVGVTGADGRYQLPGVPDGTSPSPPPGRDTGPSSRACTSTSAPRSSATWSCRGAPGCSARSRRRAPGTASPRRRPRWWTRAARSPLP
jgi:Carboxypeptidase regulatory-like domain